MWASRLFWKLFLLCVGVALTSAAAAVLMVTGPREARMVAGALALCALVPACWMVARVAIPVAALSAAAHRVADGDYDQRIYLPNRDELGELGDSFNRMSQQMSARVGELRESGQQLETVLRGMIEGVLAIDNRQRILFANDAAGRLLDFSPAEAAGRPLLETVRHHGLHRAALEALNGRPSPAAATQPELARQATRRIEITLDSSPPRVLGTQVTRLPGEPCPGVVLVLDDVTELRRLETLRREFVANVSHELKTPLSSIKAYAETLLTGGALDDPEHRGSFVARIDEQADRLHQLIQDLLSLARIESGADVHHITAVPLSELVADSLVHHAPAAEAKRIELTSDLKTPLPGGERLVAGESGPPPSIHVAADREGLREILDNLIDNAIKYTPPGGRVTIRARADGDQAVLEVEDTGIGIAADDQPRVFERFYRVDRARSRELGGTGLGLAIVKHLAQAFGGSVSLESTPGKGSTFSVRLRVAKA